ncbi:hypothetical protein L1N85_26755 [Paenibacillus alkaliterrae]|uniref:hypothetical protein n=1 Tax=Paenibacillus alkaliterrae TaxID=320909 RepID=UPI001F2D203D|nr:hypothetical protein [Paenibacillus alkaliterrae]MCF2941923.1 hypothetical protein [Paenibacillus alkaliterrae]
MNIYQDFPSGKYFTDIVLKRLRERGFIEAERIPYATNAEISRNGLVNTNVYFSSIVFLAIALI